MKPISLEYLRERIRSVHPRTRKAQLNTAIGLVVKGGGMLISLLLVPLTIDYLSKDTYGTWLTISSIVTMIALFDIGIGNGLRNRFSEAVSSHDTILARAYVSTAYLIFGILQSVFVVLFLLLFKYVPWSRILNTAVSNNQLQLVILITAVAVSIKLVFDILSYVLFALQESGRASLISFLSNALILVGTYSLTRFTNSNLIYLGLVTAISPILVLLISSIALYRDRLSVYRPALKFANMKYAKNLLSLGYKFFVIQMAVIVLFYSDNLIITQLFGPSEVTTYNVAFRYFNAATTLFTIVVTPYWSAFTEASAKKDVKWMQQAYGYLQRVWLGFCVIIIAMVVIAEPFYSVWVGNRVTIPVSLNLVMGLSVVIICWNTSTVSVINGLGKVKLQLFCSIFAALINVPLAIYLGRELGLGTTGVMLSTCLSLLPASFTGTIQAKRLINGKAYGIWAR